MKVLLVDDHEMVRLGLKSFLSMQTDIEQVLEAKNGHEGVELPEAKIVILTSYLDNEKI